MENVGNCKVLKAPFRGWGVYWAKKSASYLHRTAQPSTLATFRSWGSSTGAGRIRLAGCKYRMISLKLCKKKAIGN